MTQLEKFSFHLPYRVIIKDTKYGSIFNSLDFVTSSNQSFDMFNGNFDQLIKDKILKPYLRSFDQLTKECVQADYNNGKPFVPSCELSKWFKDAEDYILMIVDIINGKEDMSLEKTLEWCPLNVIQQLLKWHFQVGFEKGEYIEVTNEDNPY